MNDIHNKENTRETDIRSYMLAIVIMGVFTFIFLCTEYLYVNRISGNISEKAFRHKLVRLIKEHNAR